jgi:hypothetical protein
LDIARLTSLRKAVLPQLTDIILRSIRHGWQFVQLAKGFEIRRGGKPTSAQEE